MIYLGNGIYSDAGSSLSHGGTWKDHKYIKIVNGRYIYPDDIAPKRRTKKYMDSVANQGPSQAEKAQTYVYNPYFANSKYDPNVGSSTRNSKNVDMGESHESEYKKLFNQELHYFGKQYPNNPIAKYGLAALNAGSDQAQDIFKKGVDKAEDKIQELKDKKKYGKLYNTITVTKPSAAQKAQSENGASGTSKNTAGMHLEYGNQWKPAYKAKYGSFWVGNGGPSQAELAQRVNSPSGKNPNSKNVEGYRRMQENKQKEFDKSTDAYKAKYGEMGKANRGPSFAELAQRGVTGGPSAAELAQRGVAPKVTVSKPKSPADITRPTHSGNPTKYAKRPDGRDPNSKPDDHQHDIGKAPNLRAPRDNGNISGTRFYAKNKKFNKAVSSQGPSAAESAQRGMTKGSSKNVSTGSKTVQYQKKLSDTNKTYQKAVSSQGPSAAEKAQREKGSKKKPKSKNVNTGKPNKKKKNPFKKAISWITGSEGKVSVKK